NAEAVFRRADSAAQALIELRKSFNSRRSYWSWITMADTRVVLCMIVRNEEAVISRCLNAVLPHVDGYVVCDTGSTDRTVELVEEAAACFAKPGRVIEHVWHDFGHNRTLSAREARAWTQAQGWPLDRTYLLFLDADMIVRIRGDLDRES